MKWQNPVGKLYEMRHGTPDDNQKLFTNVTGWETEQKMQINKSKPYKW